MIPPLFFYQLAILGLLWLCVMLHRAWPSRGPVSSQRSVEPETSVKSRRKRSSAPKPFVGLTQKPLCALCEHEASHPTLPPPMSPDPMSLTNRRPRKVDTSRHFCHHANCDYRSWLGLGNLRALRLLLRLPKSPFPRPPPQGTPEAPPYPILRRMSSTSESRTAPRYAVLRVTRAGCRGAGRGGE